MDAEAAYLFRHALLRDAAYELQVPGERARLHELALRLIEQAYGGPAPEPATLFQPDPNAPSHPLDPMAHELAAHALAAMQTDTPDTEALSGAHRLYLARAAHHLERAHQPAAAADLWRQVAQLYPPSQCAAAMCRGGVAASLAGRQQQALDMLRAAHALAAELGEPVPHGLSALMLANHYRELGDFRNARQAATEAVPLLSGGAAGSALAGALNTMASLLRREGQLDAALHDYQRALALCDAETPRARTIALHGMATVYHEMRKYDDAERYYAMATECARDTNDLSTLGVVLMNKAVMHSQRNDTAAREQATRAAAEIFQRTGEQRRLGLALHQLAMARQDSPTTEREELCRKALALVSEAGNTRDVGRVTGDLAGILLDARRYEEAEKCYALARALMHGSDDKPNLAVLRLHVGTLYMKTERPQEAASELTRALELLQETGNRRSQATALGHLAELNHAKGEFVLADAQFKEALQILAESGPAAAHGSQLCAYAVLLIDEGQHERARDLWRKGSKILEGADAAQLQERSAAMHAACARAGVPAFAG